MGMVVRTNTMAINAFRQLGSNNNAVAKSLEKLSSGFRINRAGDDASGLAISEKMKAQITGLEQASVNAQDGISLVQTAEGNLAEVHSMLNRMVELAMKSANGILEDKDRKALQDEMNQLANEIDRIADSANFNNRKLFNGSMSGTGNTGNNNLVTSDPELTFDKADPSNAIGLESIGFTFADDATPEAKDAFNKALADGAELTFSLEDEGDSNFGNGDTLKLTGLPEGYTAKMGDTDLKDGVTHNTTADPDNGVFNLAGDFNVDIYDAEGTKVGTLAIEMGGTPTVDQTTTVQIGQAGPAAATAAADDADPAEGVKAEYSFEITDAGGGVFAANDDITICGKTYAFGSTAGGDAKDIDVDDADDLDKQMTAAAELYNNEADAKFTATWNVADKKMEFVAKEAGVVEDADKPTLAFTEAGGKLTAGTISEDVAGVDPADPNGGNNGTNATAQGSLKLQIGDSNYDYDKMEITMNNMHMDALFNDPAILNNLTAAETGNAGDKITLGNAAAIFGPGANDPANITVNANSLNIATQDNAAAALQSIRGVIEKVSDQRGALGAIQNRLEHTINNLDVAAENMNAANSRIRDTDMAKEMMQYTKMNVLVQSAQAMLAQANQQPQSILQLLQ